MPASFPEGQSSSWQQAVSTGIAINDGVASEEIRPADPGSLADSHSILKQANTAGDKYTQNALSDFSPYV